MNASILKRAAVLLDSHADDIYKVHTNGAGAWPKESRPYRDQFFELRKVSREVRKIAELEQTA